MSNKRNQDGFNAGNLAAGSVRLLRLHSAQMNLPKAIFFDLDDTILTGDAISDDCWKVVCEQYAVTTAGLDASQLYKEVCSLRRWYWSDPVRHKHGRANLLAARTEVVREALARLSSPSDEGALAIAQAYDRILKERMAPFPNAIQTLSWFKAQGVRLALITNGSSEQQRWKIRRFELEAYFELILVEGEFGTGKPEPAIFQNALDRLAILPSECWMVGDKIEFDIIGAQRLGIYTVLNDYRNKGLAPGEEVRPDRIVTSIYELVPSGL